MSGTWLLWKIGGSINFLIWNVKSLIRTFWHFEKITRKKSSNLQNKMAGTDGVFGVSRLHTIENSASLSKCRLFDMIWLMIKFYNFSEWMQSYGVSGKQTQKKPESKKMCDSLLRCKIKYTACCKKIGKILNFFLI